MVFLGSGFRVRQGYYVYRGQGLGFWYFPLTMENEIENKTEFIWKLWLIGGVGV